MRPFSLLLLVVLSAVSVAGQETRKVRALVLRDLQGRQIRLSNYKGKVVLLNFWATWCPPCRTEIPELIKLQKENAKHGLQVIGMTYPPQEKSQVRSFVRRMKINYPIALGSKRTKELFTTSEALPLTVVIDRDGTIKGVIEGILYPDEFEQLVKPLLGEGQALPGPLLFWPTSSDETDIASLSFLRLQFVPPPLKIFHVASRQRHK